MGVLLLGIAAFVAAVRWVAPYNPDDAFISYRFADNLANGHGLSFNAGDGPIEAYSNLLWILFEALLSRLGLDLPYWAPRMGVAFGIATLGILWLTHARSGIGAARMAFPMALAATFGPSVLYAGSGMETPLFGFLLLLLVLSFDRIRSSETPCAHLVLATVGFLLALTRPEGLLAFPLTVAYLLWLGRAEPAGPSRRIPSPVWLSSLAFLFAIGAYTVWRVEYFGEWLPTPFLSKGGGGQALYRAWHTNLATYFTQQGVASIKLPYGYQFLALFVAAAVGTSLTPARSRARDVSGLALLLALSYLPVYVNFVDWMPGMRYHVPLVGLLLVPIGHIAAPLSAGDPRERRATAIRVAAVASAVALASLATLPQMRVQARWAERHLRVNSEALGRWLGSTLPPNSLIALSDMGVLPYYARLPALDIHPEALVDLHTAKYGFSVDGFMRRSPKVVMLHSRGVLEASFRPEHQPLVRDARFSRDYRFLGATRFFWVNDHSYWVYVRRDLSIPADALATFPTGVGRIRNVSRPSE